MPTVVPVTSPVVEFTLTAELGDVQVPPGVVDASVMVDEIHTLPPPVMADGVGFTVASVVRKHPVPNVAVTVVVPPATPLNVWNPPEVPIVPTDGVLLVYVSDPDVGPRLMLAPVHMAMLLIAAGSGFTVTWRVAKHPVAEIVQVMFAVPAVMPLTNPAASTVATPVLLLLHATLPVVVARLVVAPAQTVAVPVIAAGFGLIDTVTLPSGPQHPPADCDRK